MTEELIATPKRDRSKDKPRETTARFTTEECRLMLRGLKAAFGHLNFTPEEITSYYKIIARLEERIHKEGKKNENNAKSEGDRAGDPQTSSASSVSG